MASLLCSRLRLSACERDLLSICTCIQSTLQVLLGMMLQAPSTVDGSMAAGMQHHQLQTLEVMAHIEREGHQPLLLRLRLQ